MSPWDIPNNDNVTYHRMSTQLISLCFVVVIISHPNMVSFLQPIHKIHSIVCIVHDEVIMWEYCLYDWPFMSEIHLTAKILHSQFAWKWIWQLAKIFHYCVDMEFVLFVLLHWLEIQFSYSSYSYYYLYRRVIWYQWLSQNFKGVIKDWKYQSQWDTRCCEISQVIWMMTNMISRK